MKDLKGTKTEANLMAAFAGESQARNKYTYYAKKAKKDGYVQIGKIFEETAANEEEHAKIWFKLLHGGTVGETAAEEGVTESAALFKMVAEIEKEHEERFKKLLGNIQKGLVFSREGDTVWICSNCGRIHVGKKAPEVCPVCKHPQSYFEIKAANY